MKRRTLLQLLLVARRGAAAASGCSRRRRRSTAADEARIRALAESCCPSEIGAQDATRWSPRFLEMGRATTAPDADTDHGYGFPRLRRTPPSPAAKYPAQLDALDERARARAQLRRSARRSTARVVEAAIAAAKIERLPGPSRRRTRRDRSDGVLLQQHRGQRPLLPRARSAATRAAGSPDRTSARRRSDGRPLMPTLRMRRLHHRRRHHRRAARAEARRASPRHVDHRRRSRQAAVRHRRSAGSDRAAHARLRREPVAGRLRSRIRPRPASSRGRWRSADRRCTGAASCNRFSEEDMRLKSHVRPRRGLADRMGRARAVLLRGRAPHRRLRRAESAAGRSAVGAVSDAGDAAVVEPAAAEGVGGEERHPVLDDAAGQEHGRRTTAAASASAATPARSVRPARAIRPTRRSSSCSTRRRSSCTTRRSSAGSCPRTAAARRRASPRRRRVHAIGPTIRSSIARGPSSLASGYCWSPHLLLASASSRFPERPGEQVRSRRPLHDRPRVHVGADRAGRRDLSGHERAAQPDLAAVLPLRDRQAVRAPRSARLGERRRPRAAAEGRRRPAAARRRAARRLAHAHQARHRARARLLRRAPVARQHADARSGGEESLRRSAAGDRAPARRGDRSAAAADQAAHLRISSRGSRASTTARSCRRAKAAITIIRPAAAAWAPIRRRASATATAARTITRICSSSDRRRCRPAAARTAR